MNIVTWKEGVDLYFKSRNQAEKGISTNTNNTTTIINSYQLQS